MGSFRIIGFTWGTLRNIAIAKKKDHVIHNRSSRFLLLDVFLVPVTSFHQIASDSDVFLTQHLTWANSTWL